ncbi:MAG TPA: PQQ-binding-like beta-propeller repeat protein [Sphingobium sp.]|nr:PQQ-binding-like beta-propeller repeat protein [Sphingobium sp.]
MHIPGIQSRARRRAARRVFVLLSGAALLSPLVALAEPDAPAAGPLAGPAAIPAVSAERTLRPVTDAMLQKPDPADWLTWRRTLDSWGYSPLDQIGRGNVKSLRLAWSRGLEPGTQEGTPLVHDGVLFFPSPNDVTQAFDAVTGDLLWQHKRRLPKDLASYSSGGGVRRNVAIYGDRIISLGSDGFIYALDVKTGEQVWESKILDYTTGTFQTSGPIIADGKIISGRSCLPAGGPGTCFIAAHDPATGRELWRTRTIPKPGEAGDESWGNIPYDKRWHIGSWMPASYDPDLKLIYLGTSVTAPAPKFMLAGADHEYLYQASTLALDPATGKIKWYYQHLIDNWDIDHVFERILLDTQVAPDAREVSWINPRIKPGERRKVVTGIPGKNGIVFTLDRQTGEFLWARPTVKQNVVRSIDGTTGKVTIDPDQVFTAPDQERTVCPAASGGKNWPAGAYSPLTETMYQPLQNTCAQMTSVAWAPRGTEGENLYSFRIKIGQAPGTSNLGTIQAISTRTGATAWKHEQRASTLSLVATGGGLLFGGDANGRFRAYDQSDGKILWEVNLGSAVTGYPVTYAVEGRQFVAVSTGMSPLLGGMGLMTPELRMGAANNLFVFVLPEREAGK